MIRYNKNTPYALTRYIVRLDSPREIRRDVVPQVWHQGSQNYLSMKIGINESAINYFLVLKFLVNESWHKVYRQ